MIHFIWPKMTSSDQSRYTLWSCQNVCDALSYLLDNIYIRFGIKLYRNIVGRNHYELISKFNVGLKTLLREGLSEPECYGDLIYKFKKLIGRNDFSFQFRKKNITLYKRIGYNLNVMRQSACLVFNPIMVDNYAAFFNYMPVGGASDSMMAPK